MTSVLKKSKGAKGKSVSMQEDLPSRWEGSQRHKTEEVADLIKFIDEGIVGKGNSFCGPYGRRKVVYCDYSGSGRALHWLEEHVLRDVLPAHGTQCTALAHASAQQQLYREESHTIIRSSVCAGADDVVVLGASLPRVLRALRPTRPTVFVSSRETERQLAPWRECQAEIIKIPESKEGFIDLNNLEQRLQENSGNGRRMIGFFAAASKLTGVLADDVATTLLLHQYGALAFWDYTLVAPYNGVDMNPTFPGVEEKMVRKDLVLFNCEKFVGGVQGPHIAVVKKDVFRDTCVYTDDVEVLSERLEESRCVEAVRAALVMRLRDTVGVQNIADRQDYITRQVLAHIKNIPELILLGSESLSARRLPIFSLMVKHPRGTFLHHNFVCAVLNDVFGIQARGGLSSNLAYGEDVLGIDNNLLREYEKLLDVEAQKEIARFRKMSDAKAPEIPIHNEHLRPGFFRISLPYFMSESELAFVLEALKMVATEGWKILPQYVINPETGQWNHYNNSVLRDRKSLYSVRFHDGKMTANDRRYSGPGIFPQTYTETLQTARNLFNRARKLAMKCAVAEPEVGFNPRIDYLRWFMLPKEAHDLLLGKSANVKHIVPFDPSGYTGARKSLISSRSNITSSPIFGSSPRHFSLSALDDCQILRLKQKPVFYSRESSLKEHQKDNAVAAEKHKPSPVQFALGESVSPLQLKPQSSIPQTVLVRSRCYSLGSDSPPSELSSETKMNLGLKESSPNVPENAVGFCHCGSQTDLQSLDDPMILPSKSFPYSAQNSISDCSQFGRSSPTVSVASHNSEDLHAYVKEMTKELATEIKSEIREVISQVDDILENSDAVEQNNLSLNSTSSHSDRNSISVMDVAEYLMGMSKEMASEVKHEIREMVNQVDEMISPDYAGNGSRRGSPPQSARRRIGSGPDLGLDLKKASQCLKKCPTSPILPTEYTKDEEQFCKRSPLSSIQSPKSVSRTPPQETSGPNSISFSSETSTPDTIIQVVTTNQNSPNLPKSLSSNKLSDEDVHCSDVTCRHYCMKKNWCQNPSVSSQDSGINMTFVDTDTYLDFGKWRTSSDPTTKKSKELQGRLRMCQRHEKSEVPDIIEGVPVCGSQPVERRNYRQEQTGVQGNSPIEEAKRLNRSSNASSSCSDRSSRSSGYGTDVQRLPVPDEREDSDDAETECKCTKAWCETDVSGPACLTEEGDSSACSDTSLSEFTCDDAPWHCPPKRVWKPALEALTEYNMVRPGDKVLVCLSGCRESVALLHTLHHYQFYSRAKGIHFSIGALYVHEPHSDVDPLHLMAYCRTLGVKLVYQDKIEDELERRNTTKPSEAHRWSTHAVRRRAYVAASSHGYHVVAVAQHLDDAARAFIANVFHCGALRTMKAHYCIREHDLRIIRPLIYVRESDIHRWAYARRLPDFSADCAVPEGRMRVLHADSDESSAEDNKDSTKAVRSATEPLAPVTGARDLLARHEQQHPGLFASLKRALYPLISSRNIEKDLKERHRKKSVIQMKNGAPVYDSEEGTDEEPVL